MWSHDVFLESLHPFTEYDEEELQLSILRQSVMSRNLTVIMNVIIPTLAHIATKL